ncbi:hypothetical protein FLP10_04035 [Agromyces intestinalis]|uniref:Histidine kinase/HSP90-like ATPase domain-containing protein n=1 Tax=Agromyces intestinalis TaxID=2592652 RepID=A0A5C1YCB4_9MICO|nr:ATP-binding protein [Agromyces intestinalis]QEO13681.1 hypothetical protein FLP10_04035 [Agromyces intestinalis]
MSRAFARAGHAAALVCVAVAGVVGLVVAIGGEPRGLIAFGIALAFAGLIGLIDLRPTIASTLVYLAGGTVIVFAGAMLVMSRSDLFVDSNNVLLSLPRTALILVGGAGIGTGIAVVWASLGWALGEAAVFVACTIVGGVWVVNVPSLLVLVLFVAVRSFDGVARRSQRQRAIGFARAGRKARELALRHEYEVRAIARLHDTVLGHLVAISDAGSGPVSDRLRAGVRHDLALVIGRDWAVERRGEIGSTAPVGDALPPELPLAFAAMADSGLRVRVTGDLAVLSRVPAEQLGELDAAVAQCIVNVARHAQVDDMELAVGVGGGEVTVAVMDSGVGFDSSHVPEDRIGLRTSIRARVEQAGGTVRLWSTKGIGTTVVLTLPMQHAEQESPGEANA